MQHQELKTSLEILTPDEVLRRRAEIEALVEPAIEHCHGDFDMPDLIDMVGGGRAFVVCLKRSNHLMLAAFCEVTVFPKKRVLSVLALGGTGLNAMAIQFWGEIAAIARLVGADSVRGAVRPSMQRLYRRIAPDAVEVYAILERKV